MKVNRLDGARPYEAPNHFGVRSLRLAGFEPDGPAGFTVGLSHILPDGGAGPDSSPLEKAYVVLAGELTVVAGSETAKLGPFDTCVIPPNEERKIVNEGKQVATMLVVMPYPDGADPHSSA